MSVSLDTLLRMALGSEQVFPRLLELFERESTTDKGRLWEELCVRYLRAKGYDEVWTLTTLPVAVRTTLSLPPNRRDMGIDLIARRGTVYSAVQCKYRKRHPEGRRRVTLRAAVTSSSTGIASLAIPRQVVIASNRLNWRELATFYALCATTGTWAQYIVMTTATSINHQGRRDAKRKTYAFGSFESITRSVWAEMAGAMGQRVGSSTEGAAMVAGGVVAAAVSSSHPSVEELRARRLAFYGVKN